MNCFQTHSQNEFKKTRGLGLKASAPNISTTMPTSQKAPSYSTVILNFSLMHCPRAKPKARQLYQLTLTAMQHMLAYLLQLAENHSFSETMLIHSHALIAANITVTKRSHPNLMLLPHGQTVRFGPTQMHLLMPQYGSTKLLFRRFRRLRYQRVWFHVKSQSRKD